jgi:HEPN domain-containing protein/predicted nucleotidyltransferase
VTGLVTIEEAKKVSQAIGAEASPLAVILFGTVARDGVGADMDLLVLTERDGMDAKIAASLRKHGSDYAIDYFVVSHGKWIKHLREGSPFLKMVQKEGRVLYMKLAMEEWQQLAMEDLSQARYLSNGGYYRGACYSAQQAVEKALKAVLLQRGWGLEKIHNIRRLLYLCTEHGVSIKWDEDEIDFLDAIYRGRYPAEEGLLPLSPPTAADASRAIGIAEDMTRQLGFSGG